MDLKEAKAKLDHVIDISRVEMYKPIQVAEVLRMARISTGANLSDLSTYRTKSRGWRDEVTQELFGKVSTSSMRFQDDLWSDTAVPPSAMAVLGRANVPSPVVEAYIYKRIVAKNRELTDAREAVKRIENTTELEQLFSTFDSPGLTSSADRLYEILAVAVFKSELQFTSYSYSIEKLPGRTRRHAVDNLVDLVCDRRVPLEVDRLGHTNAADGGLDIWTNFGVATNVKRRLLSIALLDQILVDTQVGALHIVCLAVEPGALKRLEQLNKSGSAVTVTTKNDLFAAVEVLLSEPPRASVFKKLLLDSFDKEFPMTKTLSGLITRRGYDEVPLTGQWEIF